jgi:hypothetical protein
MSTCYYCGKEIRDEAELLMKDIDIGFLELAHERKPFHRECFEVRKRKERMRFIKTLCAVVIPFAAFILIVWLLTILR